LIVGNLDVPDKMFSHIVELDNSEDEIL